MKLPIIRMLNQAVPDGIKANIKPFSVVTVTTSNLAVPETTLPYGSVVGPRPTKGYVGFPGRDPVGERVARHVVFANKYMNMFRQYHVPADGIFIVLDPGPSK
ncbi:MAG: hypothetical protein JO271_10595 [Verrucomicrobia bacterium]|nr:hypothetical protein [Verrucomicrobiota bacterium]